MKTSRSKNYRRHAKGFTHLGTFVKKNLLSKTDRLNFATTRLMTHWVEFVGEELASMSTPVDLHFDRKGGEVTLTLLSTSSHAELVRLSTPNILERINSSYGFKAIGRIRVTQAWRGNHAKSKDPFDTTKKVETLIEIPDIQVPKILADVEDERLRNTLIELGRSIAAREEARKRDSQ